MKNILQFLLCLAFLSLSDNALAQKIFSEGLIKYEVYVNDGNKPEGIYVIYIKGGNIKRELVMNNGFNNITLYNHKSGNTLSLNGTDDRKFALEITATELKEKNKRFENAVYTTLDRNKKIAGYACRANQITYVQGETANFYFTPDLIPQNESFNAMFPGLNGIPLEYEISSQGGVVMKFVATIVDIKAIDSKIFELPQEYKIVTKSELEKLK
ncbi:MAG: hypothetical protein JNJ58_01380 [Chitinophagaceae bacterium]|nr:hypothetical protein [Chitinophagaceae bacterium]